MTKNFFTKFLILILIHCNLFKIGNSEKQAITLYFQTFSQEEKNGLIHRSNYLLPFNQFQSIHQ